MKQKLVKTAIAFFGIMIAFTVLSRVAYNISTPKVILGKAENMEMGPNIIGNGVVEAQEFVPVAVEGQKTIQKISVLEGQKVKAGDVLYELDLKKLEKEIEEKKKELKGLELQIESAKSAQMVAEQAKDLTKSQAVADYERAVQMADQEIATAETVWREAQEEYRQFQGNLSLYPDKTEQECLQKIEETRKAYESAVSAKDENLYQAQKAIDLADVPEAKDTSVEQAELTKASVEKQFSALKELQSAEGKVVSPMDGVVSAVNIQVGGMTSGTADILIADTSAEMMLKVQFSEENKEHVPVGANVKLISDVLMETEKNAVGKLKITAIQQNTETGAGVEASIRIPPNTLPIGTSVGVQIETSKKMYSGCIPLEALHQEEGNQYYVYTTDEKKTILGTEVIARRVDVTVEYKGDRYAAVKGLSVEQNIILSSSKQISDGGRIKPQKQ
ncbi:MAG: biotin/lipoyl-binding protein [Clostridiales bacterium]|nr:biotin/lipoyl-binding protein [Clostridiales bacterium]